MLSKLLDKKREERDKSARQQALIDQLSTLVDAETIRDILMENEEKQQELLEYFKNKPNWRTK